MSFSVPTAHTQVLLCKVERGGFKRRLEGVIPTIQKTEHRNNGDNFCDLLITEVLFEFVEMRIFRAVGCEARVEGQTKRGFFRIAILITVFEGPERLNLFQRDAVTVIICFKPGSISLSLSCCALRVHLSVRKNCLSAATFAIFRPRKPKMVDMNSMADPSIAGRCAIRGMLLGANPICCSTSAKDSAKG